LRRRALSAALFGSTLLALASLAPACVGVLDLNDFQSAVEELCKCDAAVPQFDGNCVDVLTERLDAVTPQSRELWLSFYADTCEGSCTAAFQCYQQEATCSFQSCSESRECCGFTDGGGVTCADDPIVGQKVCTGG
jgi:hypothetical protein